MNKSWTLLRLQGRIRRRGLIRHRIVFAAKSLRKVMRHARQARVR